MGLVVQFGVNVGAVNVILNLLVSLVSFIASSLAVVGLFKLTQLHLKKHGHAPVLHESESRLRRLSSVISRFRYLRSPTALIIAILSGLLVFTEILAEMGVDSSEKCTPKRKVTDGLCANDYNGDGSLPKHVASALYVQQIKWNDEDLVKTPLSQGFRKNFNGREAFVDKKRDKTLATVVSGCEVVSFEIIPALSADLTFKGTISMWSLVLAGLGYRGKRVVGMGDVTKNPSYYHSFLIADAKGGLGGRINATFYDYFAELHLPNVLMGVYRSGDPTAPYVVRNRLPILRYRITCQKCSLSPKNFQTALQVYKSTQLESSVVIHPLKTIKVGTTQVSVPRPFSGSDVVRAVLAMKATDRDDCIGETFIYTTCGVYDFSFLLPAFGITAVLGVLAITMCISTHQRDANIDIPATAYSWSRYALKASRRVADKTQKTEDSDIEFDDHAPDGSGPIPTRTEYILTTLDDGRHALALAQRRLRSIP